MWCVYSWAMYNQSSRLIVFVCWGVSYLDGFLLLCYAWATWLDRTSALMLHKYVLQTSISIICHFIAATLISSLFFLSCISTKHIAPVIQVLLLIYLLCSCFIVLMAGLRMLQGWRRRANLFWGNVVSAIEFGGLLLCPIRQRANVDVVAIVSRLEGPILRLCLLQASYKKFVT